MRNLLFILVSAVTFICSTAYSVPFRNGMVFYQAPGYYDSQLRNQAYQTMLVHYSQKPYSGYGNGAAGVSAFASGNTVATGSILKENKAQKEEHETSYENTDAVSIAEAYPQELPQSESSLSFNAGTPQRQADQSNNEIIPVQQPSIMNQRLPEEFIPPPPPPPPPFRSTTPQQSDDEEQNSTTEITPAERTTTSVPSSTTMSPTNKKNKKKVRVDLDVRGDDDDDDDDDDDENDFVPFLKPKKNKNNGQYPLYTFFPVNFGRTSGGAIAVANSFSTGKGGARSHAIAYGTPSARQKSVKQLDEQ